MWSARDRLLPHGRCFCRRPFPRSHLHGRPCVVGQATLVVHVASEPPLPHGHGNGSDGENINELLFQHRGVHWHGHTPAQDFDEVFNISWHATATLLLLQVHLPTWIARLLVNSLLPCYSTIGYDPPVKRASPVRSKRKYSAGLLLFLYPSIHSLYVLFCCVDLFVLCCIELYCFKI